MTISLDAIFQSLGSIAKSTDVEGLATSTSEIFADGFVGKSTILGNNIGDSSGGIESLSAAMTTRAQKAQATMLPVIARVKANMPGALEHLTNDISSGGATRIAELDFDSDEISGIFADSQPLMTSASTMMHDIIAKAGPLSFGSALTAVTGLSLQNWEPAMKKLADPKIQEDVFAAAQSLQNDEGVKSLTAQVTKIARKNNSATGVFSSGNLLKDLMENTGYTVTNNVRGFLSPDTDEGILTSITNNLLNGDRQSAVNTGTLSVTIPDSLKTTAERLGIGLPSKNENSVKAFIQRLELQSPSDATAIAEYKKTVSDVGVALGKEKASVAAALTPNNNPTDVNKVVLSSDLGKPNAFKTINSIRGLVKYLHSSQREITTIVWHWSGHYSDAFNVGALELHNEYKLLKKTTSPYHLVIKKNGDIQTGTPIHQESPHTYSQFRPRSVGVVLVGGYVGSKPTDGSVGKLSITSLTSSQLSSLKIVMRAWYQAFPGGDAFGHRDLLGDGSSSPGIDIPSSVWNAYRKKNGAVPQIDNKFLSRQEIIQRSISDNDNNRP